MGIRDVLIWILAIVLAIIMWPIVMIIITWAFYIAITIGLVCMLAYFIKRGIDN